MGSGAEFYTCEGPDVHKTALSLVGRLAEFRAGRSLGIRVLFFFLSQEIETEKLSDLFKVRKVVIIVAKAELVCPVT